MPAFQTPIVTGASNWKDLLLHTSQSFFPLRCPPYPAKQTNTTRYAHLPFRCTLDASSEISTASEPQSYQALSNATIVTVQLPLDAYLEESADGRIFIDELIPGGAGQTSGLLREGDVIVAVSLPFGEELFPVPKSDGLEMIASHIASREDDTFRLAIVRQQSVEELRRQTADNQHNSASISRIRELMNEIHTPEYPVVSPAENDLSASGTNFTSDLEALREYGFDMDDILNAPDYES